MSVRQGAQLVAYTVAISMAMLLIVLGFGAQLTPVSSAVVALTPLAAVVALDYGMAATDTSHASEADPSP